MALTWKSNHEKEVLAHFEQALRNIPRLSVGTIKERIPLKTGHVTYEADVVVQVNMNNRPLTLLIETKRDVFPRDAREAVWHLRSLQKAFQQPDGSQTVVPVIACRSISEGAKDFLRSEDVSYFEEGGSLFLVDQ